MKIKYKYRNFVSFDSLESGDFFTFEGKLYFKLINSDDEFNAFNCEEDKLTFFSSFASVTPINIVLQEV